MLNNRIVYSLLIFILTAFTPCLKAQTFGFGCLGFFGGYGGYTYQSFKADGLNEFVIKFNETYSADLESQLQNYNNAWGYRVGINFFRANWQGGFIITAKGYYQSLSRKRETVLTDATLGTINQSFELDLKNWAVGIDLGFALSNFLSWKIIDGAIHFNNISITSTADTPGGTEVTKYKSEPGFISYSVGTGVIISIIKDYISLESLAGYTFLRLEDLKTEDGRKLLEDSPEGVDLPVVHGNLIQSGGFTAVVQLNVGFPL